VKSLLNDNSAGQGGGLAAVRDMTIWNASTLQQSGCLFITGVDMCFLKNCRLIGMRCADFSLNFNGMMDGALPIWL
jgi:hypothetical protein